MHRFVEMRWAIRDQLRKVTNDHAIPLRLDNASLPPYTRSDTKTGWTPITYPSRARNVRSTQQPAARRLSTIKNLHICRRTGCMISLDLDSYETVASDMMEGISQEGRGNPHFLHKIKREDTHSAQIPCDNFRNWAHLSMITYALHGGPTCTQRSIGMPDMPGS